MKRRLNVPVRLGLSILALVVIFSSIVLAGPPLICWPFQIGDAKSLPWGEAQWQAAKPEYDPSGHDKLSAAKEDYPLTRLVGDTLALLAPDMPVIVRMETLRRAALYATKDRRIAEQLLSRLMARASEAEAKGGAEALAVFDVGYLVETYSQAAMVYQQPNLASGIDGYAWVRKAIGLRGQDPEMEFAAALITVAGPREGHPEHLRKAVAGAKEGSLLARNLPLHFVHRGKTIAELRANLGRP